MAQTAAEIAALAVQEEELRAIAGNAQTAEATASTQVGELEAQLATTGSDDLLHELANRRAGAAEAQGHLRSQQSLLENTERTLRTLQEQMANKRAQIERFATGADELGAQVAVLSREEAALSHSIEALQARITPFESELAELERNLNAEQQQERMLQGHLRKEESAWNSAQLHLQRSEDALHQLRSEIEQDLGLVALEQSDEVAYQPPLPWDAFVEQLPIVESVPEGLEDEVRELRARLARIGSVNPDAPREFDEAFERHGFLLAQSQDLAAAMADLQKVIKELDERMQIELRRTFDAVAIEFTRLFQQLFNGGTAQIELTDPDHIAVSGIDIIARPPGKRPQSLALLSGGERALAAVALIFAILRVSPTPFCVLDEVDAELDEANIDRFRLLLEEMSRETQFIIVTHNRRTLEGANTIYGVTMGGDGVSRVMSLRLEGDRIIGNNDAAGEEPIPQELEEVVKL
ncbi:MAG: AAA family ATPase [Anaerolineales bacterium]|nr:AAA family ATPase [Anaerolineales bacterium]